MQIPPCSLGGLCDWSLWTFSQTAHSPLVTHVPPCQTPSLLSAGWAHPPQGLCTCCPLCLECSPPPLSVCCLLIVWTSNLPSLQGLLLGRLPPLTTMWCSPPAQPVCPLPRGPSSPWPSGHHCCPSLPFALSTLVVHRVFVTFPTARFGGASFPPDYISKSLNLPTSPTMTKFTSHIPTVVLGFCPDL